MLIPKDTSMHHLLNENLSAPELPRAHLGLSGIGHECLRYLQYQHYWAYKRPLSARIQRLFRFGHDYEEQFEKELLNRLGIKVIRQQEEIIGLGGHWKGHIDGVAEISQSSEYYCLDGFLVEMKTHNDANFKALKKKGVRFAFPMHFEQMTAYSGGLDLPGSIYVALNKNNSELYIETIEFDEDTYKEQNRKQAEVIMSDALLPRVGTNSPTWFKCKMCDAKDVCFNRKPVEKNYRTYARTDVEDGGVWTIEGKVIRGEDQDGVPKDFEYSEMFK